MSTLCCKRDNFCFFPTSRWMRQIFGNRFASVWWGKWQKWIIHWGNLILGSKFQFKQVLVYLSCSAYNVKNSLEDFTIGMQIFRFGLHYQQQAGKEYSSRRNSLFVFWRIIIFFSWICSWAEIQIDWCWPIVDWACVRFRFLSALFSWPRKTGYILEREIQSKIKWV